MLWTRSHSTIVSAVETNTVVGGNDSNNTVKVEMPMDSTKLIVKRDNPVIVVSVPKSGTYLIGELLKNLDCRWTGMHLIKEGYTDYSGADLLEARRNPGRVSRNESLSKSLNRIQPGEFAVGHLPFTEDVVQATAGFKRLYLTRDLRFALISYMRFMHTTGRLAAEQWPWYSIPDLRKRLVVFLATTAPFLLKQFYQCMVGWSQFEGITQVRFEDLTADAENAIRVVDSVATFLGVRKYDAQSILQSSLAAETITKSGELTQLDKYWSLEAEKRFIKIGGPELNDQLGCSIRGNSGTVSHASVCG